MEFIKSHLAGLLMAALEVIVGILLMVNPVGFTAGIIIAIGVFVTVMGVISIVRYIRTPAENAAKTTNLFQGLAAVFFGVFCVFGTTWWIAAFPVLAMFYGILQLIAGLQKVQTTVDALRLKNKLWYVPAIGALLSLVCGWIIVKNPEMTVLSIWVFTGLSLIIEGVFDAVTLWFTNAREA